MYKITSASDGADLGMTEAPVYIMQAANGCFVLCSEPKMVQGICFAGTVYNLLGKQAMTGVENTVMLEPVDAGELQAGCQYRHPRCRCDERGPGIPPDPA